MVATVSLGKQTLWNSCTEKVRQTHKKAYKSQNGKKKDNCFHENILQNMSQTIKSNKRLCEKLKEKNVRKNCHEICAHDKEKHGTKIKAKPKKCAPNTTFSMIKFYESIPSDVSIQFSFAKSIFSFSDFY